MVTVSFYSGLHIINVHLKKDGDLEYIKHGQTLHALNPEVQLSITKTSFEVYEAYRVLYNHSRIARYLYDPKTKLEKKIYDKYFNKAYIHLTTIIDYFNHKHNFGIKIKDLKVVA